MDMNYDTPPERKTFEAGEELAISLTEYTEICDEIEQQPFWRGTADKEMDYADGNQLDSELLQRQRALGIPPAVENLVNPALLSIQGYEAKTRTDWRVTPNGQPGGQDVADGLNFKLNEAEKQSKADRACAAAFRPQIGVGVAWVEVARQADPFSYRYRCRYIHRNEIHWDMKAQEDDLSDARWLRRQRWLRPDRIAKTFPKHRELIETCGRMGSNWWGMLGPEGLDGGMSTGLRNSWDEARSWTVQEDRWFNPTSKELCLVELWYRRWVSVTVLTMPDGRVVEYDEDNMAHNIAIARGHAEVSKSVVSRVRRSFWLGPHLLHDGPTPYPHPHFPYAPFIGFREDGTGKPYGYIRDMIFPQDSLNSGISKLRWGMGAVRTERTKGAVAMSDAQFRQQVARVDADILLDPEEMQKTGARFEVKRDYTLTEQHYKMLDDNRATIQRVSAVTSGFMGKEGTARSGLQEQTQVEQSNQSLGVMMDNFRTGRKMVGELLLALIIEDLGRKEAVIVIEGDAVRADRSVTINKVEQDPDTGLPYLSNDVQRTRLMVGLEEVPSTNTFRGQQVNALSEAVKSLPPQYQAAAMPFLVSLMDVPFKRDLVEALRAAGRQASPEEIDKQVQERVAQEVKLAGLELKARELDMKERLTEAQIKQLMAQAVQTGVQAAFAAMQGGVQVAQMPMIAPIADAIMQGAGYTRPSPGGDDPNFPTPSQTAAMNIKDPYIQGQGSAGAVAPAAQQEAAAAPPVRENTSPTFPPRPRTGGEGMNGIETARTSDNLEQEPA